MKASRAPAPPAVTKGRVELPSPQGARRSERRVSTNCTTWPCLSVTRAGFEPNLAILPFSTAERIWRPHQKSNAPCVWTYLLCVPANPTVLEVGWKALESCSPGLQPGVKPSQLPAHLCALHVFSATKKPGVLCVTPGFLKARGGLGPMSRAQGMRRVSATQTCTPRIASKWMLKIGPHGLRCEQIRPGLRPTGSELSRIALSAIGHQPEKHHDPQDLFVLSETGQQR